MNSLSPGGRPPFKTIAKTKMPHTSNHGKLREEPAGVDTRGITKAKWCGVTLLLSLVALAIVASGCVIHHLFPPYFK